MAAAENLQRAQLEIKQKSTRASQKQQSPVKKVFKDDDRQISKLARNKSGTMRTPLNLDVA
jgi:tRNA(Arg) A34 adenosine deaminase TadA